MVTSQQINRGYFGCWHWWGSISKLNTSMSSIVINAIFARGERERRGRDRGPRPGTLSSLIAFRLGGRDASSQILQLNWGTAMTECLALSMLESCPLVSGGDSGGGGKRLSTYQRALSSVCTNENGILVEYETKIIFYLTILNYNNRKAFSLWV